jgi:hypothetical protein
MNRNQLRKTSRSLSNGACVNDEVVVCFSKMFNEWEYKTFLTDSDYCGAIVMTSNLVETLCFWRINRMLRTAYDPDSFHWSLTMTVGEGVQKKRAAIDLFEQNSLLIFPYNEGIWHWVIFCVDSVSLNQSFYDNLNKHMSNYKYCEHVSRCIHRWVIDYHKIRKCTDHPKWDLRWSPELVEDHEVLGNGMQIGCDCGLHILVLPVLIQKQLMLDVFGQTSKEKEVASIEIRQW